MSNVEPKELSEWILIFHHNSKSGYFKNLNEALYSKKQDRFSVLGNIDDRYLISGYFEFRIVYPEIEDYLEFKQNKNPLKLHHTDEFECQKIHFEWEDPQDFECLTLHNGTKTLLEGQKSLITWFYAIGQFFQEGNHILKILGPQWKYNGIELTEVNLFIKVIDKTLIPHLFSFCTLIQKQRKANVISIYCFVIILT